MRKAGKIAALALLLAAQPTLAAFAAEVTWPEATSLVLSGSSIVLTIDAGAQADTITINPTSFTVTVAAAETFTVRYPGPSYGTMTNDGSVNDCNIVGSDNVAVVNCPKTVTFTPSASTCVVAPTASGGGGGGNAPASIKLYVPNGGESFQGGSSQKIFWTYAGSQGRSASLSISLNDGEFLSYATQLNLALGYYDLVLPTVLSNTLARMRIQLVGEGDSVLASDDSDASFTILAQAAPVPPPEEVVDIPEAYDPSATIDTDKGLMVSMTASGVFCRENKLIKLPDDGDPVTQHDSSVYYCGGDGKRYVFPNPKIYTTWYGDFSGVRVITPEEMAVLPLGGNVTYRPGSRLVKIQSDPKTYAVEGGGLLRHVPDEATAVALFGAAWSKLVDDIDVAFFLNYRIGQPVAKI